MKQYLRKDVVFPLVTLACIVALCLTAGLYVYRKHQWVQNQLTEFVEPRYARLAGVQEGAQPLTQAHARAQEIEALYLHPAEQDSNQAGNEAQQRIRNLLGAAGMSIVSSQVLPSKDEGGLERIPIAVHAEGDIISLHGALVGVAEQRPAVLVDAVNMQAQGVPERGVQRLSVQFSFVILRRPHP